MKEEKKGGGGGGSEMKKEITTFRHDSLHLELGVLSKSVSEVYIHLDLYKQYLFSIRGSISYE